MSQQNMTITPTSNYKLEIPTHIQHVLLVGVASGVIGIILLIAMSEAQRLLAVVFLVVGIVAGLLEIVLFSRHE